MSNNQLIKYSKNPIQRFFKNIWNRIKARFSAPKLWDDETENLINTEFPDVQKQSVAKELLEDLLSRNQYLFDTLDIRILNKDMLKIFGKPLLERIIADKSVQEDILQLSDEELKTYEFVLNYKTTDKKERITNIPTNSLKNINYEELQNLNVIDRTKAISIILSNSEFKISDLSELDDYYEKRRIACEQIINNPNVIDEYDYDTYWEKFDNGEEIDIPYGVIEEMKQLDKAERIRFAIIEAKYGMSLEKAKKICKSFGRDIEKIEHSEETRIVKEINKILDEEDIEKLQQADLSENFDNYEGTLNIVPNLRNSYLHEYKKTLYQIKDEDYIETRDGVQIYNALGKNNDNAEFNMILTSIGGVYAYSHDFSKGIKEDWDRADSNHTISCSYIGNDFLGVADLNCLLGFADVKDNELIHSRNQDAGAGDSIFEAYAKSEFLIPKNQINTSKKYNEMVVERKIEEDGKLVNRKPTYAVFLTEHLSDINDEKNNRWQTTKRMAQELDIPIVVIDVQKCMELEWQKTQEMINLIKEQKQMDLIPEVIHKMENNRGISDFSNIRKEIFSDDRIKDSVEQIMGTIITSNTQIANQEIEGFVKVTKEIMQNYKEHTLESETYVNDQKYKTYNYQEYLDRLKVLFGVKNNLFNKNEQKQENLKSQDKNIEENKML